MLERDLGRSGTTLTRYTALQQLILSFLKQILDKLIRSFFFLVNLAIISDSRDRNRVI